MRKIRVFASSVAGHFGTGTENFGDNLMGPLLRGLFDVEPEFVKPSDAELIGIGSILDALFRLGGDSKLEYVWKRLNRRPLHV